MVEEIKIGYIPHRDGSDYSESLPTPTWNEIVFGVPRGWRKSSLVLCFCGKIGSPGTDTRQYGPIDCTCGSAVRWEDMQKLPYEVARRSLPELPELIKRTRAIAMAAKMAEDEKWTGQFAKELLGYRNDFVHITGVVVKRA